MRKILALDANLLVLLTVGYADIKYIARHKRLYPTYRKEHFDLLLEESWPRKTGQDDKWIFRLTAASIAAHQERS